jgi:outer membrane protein TolC
MKRRIIRLTVLVCATALWGQENVLGLRDLPALVLGADPQYNSSAQAALYALHDSQGSIAQAFPQIDLTNQYSLGWVPMEEGSKEIPSGSSTYYHATVYDQTLQSLSTTLSISQILPTAGSLSLNVGNKMTITDLGEIDIDPAILADYLDPFGTPQFNQKPSFALRLDQPILLNGKLIDMELFPATLRTASLGYQKAECAKRDQANKSILQAVQLFLQVVQFRKSIAQTEKTIAVGQGNLDNLQRSFALGSVAEADLLDQKIAFAAQKSALLDLKMNLKKGERALAQSIGRDSLEGMTLADDIPRIGLTFADGELLDKAMVNHPLIQQQSLAAEEKRLMGIIGGQKYASSFSLGFSYSPTYPYSSDAVDMDFPTSLSRLFESGGGQDFMFSAGLTIHLFDGGQAEEARAAAGALAAAAETALVLQRQAVRDQLELDLLKKENLGERIPMMESAVDLAKRRLDAEISLRALGKTTNLVVDSKRADYEAKQNDLWRARADLTLVSLELASLTGDDIALLIQGNSK